MKATLRGLGIAVWLSMLAFASASSAETAIRLDNFWSDGTVRVFLYGQPHAGLEPGDYDTRYDLRPGQVFRFAADGAATLWADVRVMRDDGSGWLLSSLDCGYGTAIAVHPGETVEIAYTRDDGYASGEIGLRCRVLDSAVMR